MEFFSQTYVALRGPTGAPQSATETIARLSDRLSPATLLADRRAAVLSLKGLARDWKEDVGDRALQGILDVLANDAEVDVDIGKAALETLNILCDVDENRELGFKHTDIVLSNDKTVHTLFALLADQAFYTRFATLQYLSTLLENRRQIVQGYFLKAPAGPSSVILVLEDTREIIRNEAVTMVQALISQSVEIQKVLAFEGAFEKLFTTITQEGGVEGGAVPQEVLTCVDGLLRGSLQSYFRELALPPILCSLLLFPPNLPPDQPAPQEFALQFWDDLKAANVTLVVGIMGMLISSAKGNSTPEVAAYTRCLIEMALASNAPTPLKTQALHHLPPNVNYPLAEMILTPYCPVPDTNGEEWDRLEPATALDVLVELALHGEYNGADSEKRLKDGLELRTAAVGVFENFVRQDEVRLAILQAMLPAEGSENSQATPLLHSLSCPPNTSSAPAVAPITSTHLSVFLFAHLLRSSPRAKALARSIVPPSLHSLGDPNDTSGFFVPADGGPAPGPPEPEPEDDEDPPQALLPLLCEHLSLASLARARLDSSEREAREWDRLVGAYLCLLCQWLWEEPLAVKDFLDAGGLSVLVEAINQTGETDSVAPGLCAFLLGVCYEFDREPGEITRTTIYPIINRLGVETLVGRMTRLRDDERFKAVGPDLVVLPFSGATPAHVAGVKGDSEKEKQGEIWFDWAFIDFWKSNYYTVQRSLSSPPDQLASSNSGPSAESAMLIASLRDVIKNQAQEMEALKRQLQEMEAAHAVQKEEAKGSASAGVQEIQALQSQLASANAQVAEISTRVAGLTADFESSESKTRELEKEQEDLLVLLDEVSAKRKTDKARMREAGMDVSEDEADEDEDEDEE
ncbi:unnamed protein product [Mycena citricolor]|uniref:General vesicular transport factor p115 n=1 Tax=Mycena citricolor TaxID=2018698 RepID=A0AAD2HXE9_9AGAR|nr:unnamed protein product [Mycena citricolor]